MKTVRYTIAILVVVISSLKSRAENTECRFAEWGHVTQDELRMTECAFEKKADAMLLLDLGEVHYRRASEDFTASGYFRINTAYYQRYKIFAQSGAHHTDKKILISTGSTQERLKNIYAVCYNLVNGEITKSILQEADIHRTQLSDGTEQVSFAVPGVVAGSVVEIAYEREEFVTYHLPRWYFTQDIPSAKSSITVGYLDAMIYYVEQHLVGDTLEIHKEPFTSTIMIAPRGSYIQQALTGVRQTYTAYNVESYQDEPFINSSRNYRSWISFQLAMFQQPLPYDKNLVSSFDKLSEQLYTSERFVDGLEVHPIPRKEWMAMLNDNMSKEVLAKTIYEYIRANVTDNGNTGFAPQNSNTKVWKDRTGSQTEINMLLISELRASGIEAYPILVSSRYQGNVNQDYPILNNYEAVDALVMIDGKNAVVLDATEKELPFGEPPLPQVNTTGWVVKGVNEHFWYDIREKRQSLKVVNISAALDEAGTIAGTIDITYTNHDAENLIHRHRAGKKSLISEALKTSLPNINIEAVSDSIVGEKCYYIQKVRFTTAANTDNDGNVYISIANIYGSSTNPFVSRRRVADVDFGYTDRTLINMKLAIPASYTADSILPRAQLRMSDTSASFTNRTEVSDGLVTCAQKLDFSSSFYPARAYPALYEFERGYYDLRQKPLVLHKK